MDYLTMKETAKLWGVSDRMINYYCAEGRIKGAVKKGNLWLIPSDAQKPEDRRCTVMHKAAKK